MSDTSQEIPHVQAKWLLEKMMSCAGMAEHLQQNGAEQTSIDFLKELLVDEHLCFFSIKKVIDRQKAKAIKVKDYIPEDDQAAVAKTIGDALSNLPYLRCQICGLNGHTNSSCWLNGQIYNSCRTAGAAAQDANFLWREAIKLKRVAREEGMRQVTA